MGGLGGEENKAVNEGGDLLFDKITLRGYPKETRDKVIFQEIVSPSFVPF